MRTKKRRVKTSNELKHLSKFVNILTDRYVRLDSWMTLKCLCVTQHRIVLGLAKSIPWQCNGCERFHNKFQPWISVKFTLTTLFNGKVGKFLSRRSSDNKWWCSELKLRHTVFLWPLLAPTNALRWKSTRKKVQSTLKWVFRLSFQTWRFSLRNFDAFQMF